MNDTLGSSYVNPVRDSADRTAGEYMGRRWQRSHAARYDYKATADAFLGMAGFTADDRVLEVGCGPGAWTKEIAERVAHVTAVDLSGARLEIAKQYTAGLPVDFIHGDFTTTEINDRFDKVVSLRAIEYMPDFDQFVQRAVEVLKPGGSVVLVTKNRYSAWRGRMRVVYALSRRRSVRQDADKGEIPVQYLRSSEEIASAFAPYGLVPTGVKPIAPRPPVFRGGFHEYPVIPDLIAAPFLWLSERLFTSGRSAMWMSESYCIRLEATGESSR